MNGELILFLLLSAMSIIGGILMITLRQVIHMVLALVVTFLSLAGVYFMLSAEFVAVVQILIYSGAVTIVLIFGIMLTKYKATDHGSRNTLRTTIVGIGVLAFFLIVYRAIRHLYIEGEATTLHVNNTEQIGEKLFAHYVIPFELVSVVLLVALVGAVVLTKGEGAKEE
ncbi:NADH-quinone oxidoreductase subunit J [Salirhabdus salicampi]|uniref:NADH-quinone oxidoreductase subunit J n=1 Tax=Salirhabdus salicampi TaxID=476102 RepID=UPI0020C29610|nr:NADH-quinone oxidoreductase subunit J [Salirhabdus salicampi]MCP8617454.1 NADH-quinone oxidoreductase subunit J [Salirhabdus salicampi]